MRTGNLEQTTTAQSDNVWHLDDDQAMAFPCGKGGTTMWSDKNGRSCNADRRTANGKGRGSSARTGDGGGCGGWNLASACSSSSSLAS